MAHRERRSTWSAGARAALHATCVSRSQGSCLQGMTCMALGGSPAWKFVGSLQWGTCYIWQRANQALYLGSRSVAGARFLGSSRVLVYGSVGLVLR